MTLRRDVTPTAHWLPFLLAASLVPSLHSPAAADAAFFRFHWKAGAIQIKSPDEPDMPAKEIAKQTDETYMNGPAAERFDPPKNRREDILVGEGRVYEGTGYTPVANGEIVNGYRLTENVPTSRQNCAGLAMARFIGGPLNVETTPALALLRKVGQELPLDGLLTQPNDVVVFMRDGEPQHLALVEQGGTAITTTIISKDGQERVYRGLAHRFPTDKNFGAPIYFRVDWDAIDVRRLDEAETMVPSMSLRFGGATAPSPRVQKTLIEAANEISSALSQPRYAVPDNLTVPGLSWQWREGDIEPYILISCADYAPPSTKAKEIARVWVGRAPTWGGRPIRLIELPATPNDLGVRDGPADQTCGYIWSCGRHLLTAGGTVRLRSLTGRPSKEQLAEADAISGRLADTMFQILSQRAIANGLDKPERPRKNYPYEGAAGP